MSEIVETVRNNSNLFKAFIKFETEFKGLKPDANNPFFKSSYITLDGILETVRPILAKNGLAVIQEATGDGEFIFVRTKLIHESGDFLETDVLKMKPAKNDPQQMGSCITYAKRYQLGALLGICESVDDDGNKATYGNGQPNKNKKEGSKSRTTESEVQSGKCSNCGKEVNDNVAKFSVNKFKKVLCIECQKLGGK